jgi:hypothetical protein
VTQLFAEACARKGIQSNTHEYLKRAFTQLTTILLATLVCSCAAHAQSRAKRVVMLKIDGLPYEMVERFARESDPQTGKSLLPWFDSVFFQNGTRLTNFYVRGMSLSAPSWSTLDTGQHLHIKGNVEFDRDILQTYDYLNFIPFYFKQATGSNVDMPGTEVLDSLGVPMLVDAYDNYQRFPGGQLYGRGARIKSLQRAGQEKFLKHPITLAGEFITGFDMRGVVPAQLERELIERLKDQRVQYLDLYETSFDHVAHHNNDRESHLVALREIDGVIGRVWTGIQKSPLAADTVLIVVSDHGFNTDERVISQGYNLVKLLGSYEGGGHHVVTKRRLLMDYSLKAVNPFVPPITTTASQSYYLKNQSAAYPTALLDFDGNERAGLHLRNSLLNLLHILLQQLQWKDLSPPLRRAATDAFFAAIACDKRIWQGEVDQLNEELVALRPASEKQRELCAAQPKKFTVEDQEMGRDDNARRVCVLARQWADQLKGYSVYVATMRNLLSLRPEKFDPFKLKIRELIPEDSMAQRNSVYDLQNYIVGPGRDGLVLKTDGSLDLDRSFTRINYLTLIHRQESRNNVQPGIGNRPVDFIATRIPRAAITHGLSPESQPDEDVVWLYGGPDRQALVLARGEAQGRLQLRYLPVANLVQDEEGRVHFDLVPWQQGLPLRLLEDPRLDVPLADRVSWLNDWHTDADWLHAVHKTQYSNGLIGLHEQFTLFTAPSTDVEAPGLTNDERLLRRFRRRQRQLVETDMLIMANNHWNFDVRGFNPGGNHGSFLRISTHAVLMFAGGEGTGIPKGLAINEPYDSLSLVPTIFSLTGNLGADNQPAASLASRGFRKFPGRVIPEVTGAHLGQPAQ